VDWPGERLTASHILEELMRTMLKITIPVEPGNRAIKDGSLPKLMNSVMEKLHPEAAYFYPEGGKRTTLMVFDMKDASQIPSVVEPFFMGLDADISLTPVMNAADLKAGLEAAAKSRS
jgi:hypothetical protein